MSIGRVVPTLSFGHGGNRRGLEKMGRVWYRGGNSRRRGMDEMKCSRGGGSIYRRTRKVKSLGKFSIQKWA